MKRYLSFFLGLLVCFFCVSCSSPADSSGGDTSALIDASFSDPEVDAHNIPFICHALDIDEDGRNIPSLLRSLDAVGAGKIQEMTSGYKDGWFTLFFTSEDGTHFCMYLNSNNTAEAVQNLDTGEWPLRSIR